MTDVKTLYFDCFAGISGDMVLGALAGAGADREAIAAALDGLPVGGFELTWERVNRNGIESDRAVVTTAEDHHHRGLGAVLEIIEKGRIGGGVKKTASAIFRNLAEAEAAVHGKSVDEIHFHEVGALDAIVDIVGAATALDSLAAELIIASPVRAGFGTVRCAHGDYPIPAPGTAALLRSGGIPCYAGEIEGEWTTPTGAAILSAVCSRYQSMPRMDIESIGYGAGGRTHPDLPNLLRVFVGRTEGGEPTEVVVMETEIDDTNPQLIGHLHNLLPAVGALDWYTTPVQMKKNRPGTLLTVICEPAKQPELADLLFRETTTIGYRYYTAAREELQREIVRIATPLGDVDVKVARRGGEVVNAMPEFEDLRRIAEVTGRPLKQVSDMAIRTWLEQKDTKDKK